MTREEIAIMVGSIGLPYRMHAFSEAVEPPYICYDFLNPETEESADNRVWSRNEPVQIELYTKKRDFELEKQITDVLDEHGIDWEIDHTWLDSEKMHETILEFDNFMED